MKSVLIVEDEPAVRGLLSLMLEGEDYNVRTAEDGQEALDQVETARPDAILLDLNLPRVSGWQVIDWLDRDHGAEKVPIIAVTAGAKKVAVGQHGIKAFLSKPFDLDTLLVVLDQVLH
jgi:CheY-like chemotaxis protein